MELVLEFFGWLIRALFSGIVFAGALHYMEGKRILRGTVSVLFCGVAGMLANLVSDGLLYGLAGFSRQGAAGVFAGLAMAALMAASFSAAGCLPVRFRKKRVRSSGKVLEIRRQLDRAA